MSYVKYWDVIKAQYKLLSLTLNACMMCTYYIGIQYRVQNIYSPVGSAVVTITTVVATVVVVAKKT